MRDAQIFVAVLGASSYTYAEATWTQSLPDWISSHIRALEFFGGATEILVRDNLKSAVIKPHLYEPELNPTYQETTQRTRAPTPWATSTTSSARPRATVMRSAGSQRACSIHRFPGRACGESTRS